MCVRTQSHTCTHTHTHTHIYLRQTVLSSASSWHWWLCVRSQGCASSSKGLWTWEQCCGEQVKFTWQIAALFNCVHARVDQLKIAMIVKVQSDPILESQPHLRARYASKVEHRLLQERNILVRSVEEWFSSDWPKNGSIQIDQERYRVMTDSFCIYFFRYLLYAAHHRWTDDACSIVWNLQMSCSSEWMTLSMECNKTVIMPSWCPRLNSAEIW